MEVVVEAESIYPFTLSSMGIMLVTEPVNLLSSSQSTDSAFHWIGLECLQIIVKRQVLMRKRMRWMINEEHSSLGRRMQFSYLIHSCIRLMT